MTFTFSSHLTKASTIQECGALITLLNLQMATYFVLDIEYYINIQFERTLYHS